MSAEVDLLLLIRRLLFHVPMFPCTSRNVPDNFCTCILVPYICTMHALLHAPVDDVMLCHVYTQNCSPRKRARMSLERKWWTPGDIALGDSLISPETPVRNTSSSRVARARAFVVTSTLVAPWRGLRVRVTFFEKKRCSFVRKLL